LVGAEVAVGVGADVSVVVVEGGGQKKGTEEVKVEENVTGPGVATTAEPDVLLGDSEERGREVFSSEESLVRLRGEREEVLLVVFCFFDPGNGKEEEEEEGEEEAIMREKALVEVVLGEG
jgi:hypothetical protein